MIETAEDTPVAVSGAQRQRFGKVAVLLGGRAAERAISLRSGAAVLAALQQLGVDAHPLDPAETDVLTALRGGGFDRACIMLHGRGGEDGQIQGALESIGMPYTGSGVLGSALGMDKYRCKLVWGALGLPTAEAVLMRGAEDLPAAAEIGFPLMIKPVHEGSSIGMARVANRDALEAAWQAASTLDAMVLAERWIQGAEYTCAILGRTALPLIRLETPNTFYDFQAKYEASTTQYHCPCGLDQPTEARLQQLALAAFDAVGASGWGRVDFMVDASGQPFLLEINTVPGMTDHSLVPMAARVGGLSFGALALRILETSVAEQANG